MGEKYLEGRVAAVTGGASGMGRAMALALASKGADVSIGSLLAKHSAKPAKGELVYMPDEEIIAKTRKEIKAMGVKSLAMDLDVCSTHSCEAFYEATVETFGKIDILANSAGITAEHPVCGHPEDLWLKVMDVCANGPFRTTKLVLPGMIARKWGRIINIASTAASVGAPTSAAYCAANAPISLGWIILFCGFWSMDSAI